MKKLLLFLLCLRVAYGETTDPIGVTNVILPVGTMSDPSYTFISSAYNQDPAYSGSIDAIDGSQLTLSDLEDNNYEDNELIQTAHLLRLRDGDENHNGMVFPVLSNIGDNVVIGCPSADIPTYFSLYDSVDIIEANTLGGLFGTGADFLGLSGKPAQGDNILIWTTYGWKTYFYYQDKWQTFGTRSDQGATIIYPDEGMVYVRKSDELTLSFSGYVPLIVQSYRPGSDHKFLMSNPFPVTVTLSQLIDTSSNWISNTSVNAADQILSWSGTAWVIHYHNGDDWINLTAGGAIDDKEIQAAESFFIVRAQNIISTAGYNKISIPE
jgi:hypothetical protein